MTGDRLAGELPGRGQGRRGTGRSRVPKPDIAEILSVCDRQLGEPGRRGHVFTWLRPEGAGAEGWLPVDAYYPRARLVVVYRARRGAHDELYRELIPRHGLRLLELTPADIGSTPAGAERAVTQMLEALPAAPSSEPPQAEPASSRRLGDSLRQLPRRGRKAAAGEAPAASSPPATAPRAAFERGSRFVAARRGSSPVRDAESPMWGVAVGLGLTLLLVVAVVYVLSAVG